MNELQEEEKQWIANILKSEMDDFEALDYIVGEGFSLDDIVEVYAELM